MEARTLHQFLDYVYTGLTASTAATQSPTDYPTDSPAPSPMQKQHRGGGSGLSS